MDTTPPQPEIITKLFEAVYPSFAMLAGMELDLFTVIDNGPFSAEQIADALDVQVTKLRPLLYALVATGLLTINDNLFSNAPQAEYYLVRGKPGYLGGILQLTASNWSNMLNTAATIRTGGPPEKYDYHAGSQDALVALFRGLYPGAVADGQRLMKHYDLSAYNSLLDVGGGSGALAIEIARANPHLKATVLDLPSVTPITRQFIQEANMTERIGILSADAVQDELMGAFDVVVARHVIQVLSVDDSRALLKNLAAVMKPGGVVYLIGWILDNSRQTPQNTVFYNLVLLNGYDDGQAYTEREYHDWLTEAGFEDFERVVFPDGSSILTAHKTQVSPKVHE